MPLINKKFVEDPWSLPANTRDLENDKFPHPIERIKHEPDEVVEDDLIWEQAKNELFLGLKMGGEQVAFYRQKETGQMCSCVDKNRQSAVSSCPVCHGAKYVGGYDYLGKTLVHFPQAPKTKIITNLGLKLQEEMKPWTLNYPLLRDRDFLVRKIYLPISDQVRIVEEPVIRGNYSSTEDILSRINILVVWKISNAKQDDADYTEGTDYILLGGEMVLAESGNAPIADKRTLRLLGKKPSIFRGNWEGPEDERTIKLNAGLSAGMNVKVKNDLLQSQLFDVTLEAGTGSDTGYFVFTIEKTGAHSTTAYPLSSFIATIPGDRIVWLDGGNKPDTSNTYYITYDYVQTYTRRYQVTKVSPVAPQGAVMFQSFDLTVFEPTHPIYQVGSIFDNGQMIDFRNGVTKEMTKQLFGEFGLATGNQDDKRFNQEAGYY